MTSSSDLASIITWLTQWFSERNPGVEIKASVDFYEERYIDSFGIIELIDVAEGEFNIMFDDDDFKKAQFRKIEGLAAIIQEKLGG